MLHHVSMYHPGRTAAACTRKPSIHATSSLASAALALAWRKISQKDFALSVQVQYLLSQERGACCSQASMSWNGKLGLFHGIEPQH